MDPLSIISGLATSIISRIWPDKTEAQKQLFALELQKELAASELAKGQIEINKVEAAHSNLFVSGWRPFIGWVCGCAFAWQYVIAPMLTFLIVISGQANPNLPVFGMDVMLPVLMGMLGLGGLRTLEKNKSAK